ncbi:MAG: MFS transporter [Planctomycetota bacterium]
MSTVAPPTPPAARPEAGAPLAVADGMAVERPADVSGVQTRNFVVLAAHQVLLRVGWIFKTESIVMPAFMSHIGGGPVLLGMMPVLSRLGFSVPPLLYAQQLKVMPRKKWSVAASTLAMAGPFALLSAAWFLGAGQGAGGPASWMPLAFLVVYGVFFCLTGVNQLGSHALQGKLIRPDLRGRLFTASVLAGAPAAIAAAALLLPAWLELPGGGFGWIFGAVAVAFLLAGLTVSLSVERPDNFTEESTNPWQKFQDAWSIVRSHADARAAGILAALISVNLMLFPHYQAIGAERFGLGLGAMTVWVCVQNAATAVVSLIAGPLADRCGNRAALRFCVLGLCVAPVAVLVFLASPASVGRDLFWLVFSPLGFTPVTIRLLINYTLEIAPAEEHTRFVSAIGMCLAMPVIVGSPLVGWLLGAAGSGWVFAGGLVLLLAAAAQTCRLSEPRHASR